MKRLMQIAYSLIVLVSRDRETTDSATGGGGMRFSRNQSPSTHRRSRERDRGGADKQVQQREIESSTEDRGNMTAEHHHTDLFDDSRLSGTEEIGYQTFTSTEDVIDRQPMSFHSEGRQHQRTNSCQALDRLNTKLPVLRNNVNEYLKLAANADKQQLQRIKAVFEKKNQKSAHTISQLQKKLESYSKRVKDLQYSQRSQQQQTHQHQSHRQPREVLRDVGQGLKNVGGNIRDGITGLGGSV
uniref:Uncharacterized protein n=1 Tax=Lutzomyia longipalpis TaxID=7200 RepID=A0A1B0GGX5_LUTLO